MASKRETVCFESEDIAAMEQRLEEAKKIAPKKPSLKVIVAQLYPKIKELLEAGYTRSQVYEIMLTSEQRAKISEVTFVGYYQAARKAEAIALEKAKADEARRKREAAKAAAEQAALVDSETKEKNGGGKKRQKREKQAAKADVPVVEKAVDLVVESKPAAGVNAFMSSRKSEADKNMEDFGKDEFIE